MSLRAASTAGGDPGLDTGDAGQVVRVEGDPVSVVDVPDALPTVRGAGVDHLDPVGLGEVLTLPNPGLEDQPGLSGERRHPLGTLVGVGRGEHAVEVGVGAVAVLGDGVEHPLAGVRLDQPVAVGVVAQGVVDLHRLGLASQQLPHRREHFERVPALLVDPTLRQPGA